MNCPLCKKPIAAEDINVQTDVAFCRSCQRPFALSEVAHGVAPPSLASVRPPPGAWYSDDGIEARVGATTRSWMALFLIPFMCVWTGFSLGGIYGSQIAKGKFDPGMSAFGIPFVLGSILFWSLAVMSVCGKSEIVVRGGVGEAFTGVGALGWRRRFDATAVRSVREDWSGFSTNRRPQREIVIEADRRIGMGAMLNAERRAYLIVVLREMLMSK
jgi:hypothetical protein